MLQTPPSAQRIRLRPERPWQEHLDLYSALFADPAIADALWPGTRRGIRAGRRGAQVLAEDVGHWQRESFGPWIFFETTTGSFVGRGGLRRTTVPGRDSVELSYAVRSELWGAGYGTEMAKIAVARARWGLTRSWASPRRRTARPGVCSKRPGCTTRRSLSMPASPIGSGAGPAAIADRCAVALPDRLA
jgi:RimJ/RimL family protein N-acetyltransferase